MKFPVQKLAIFRKVKEIAEAYNWCAAQVIPQINAEIAEKGNFWMETI